MKRSVKSSRLLIRIGVGLGIFLALILVFYFWPTYNPKLAKAPTYTNLTYDQAMTDAKARVATDTADSNVRPNCRSVFMPQAVRTTKVVVLLHGYTPCPDQMQGLAEAMFAQGYTVYSPRAPLHGEYDHDKLLVPPSADLVDYASDAASIAKGLSNDAGMIGLSGGGVLTSWTAHYRPDAIKHVEILDPFFEPAVAQSPKWQVRLLIDLYGLTHILPDVANGDHGSYRGLSEYLLIGRNIPDKADETRTAALVLSPGDTLTDLDLSRKRFGKMFPGGRAYLTPIAWDLEHDNVSVDHMGTHGAEAYADYIRVYEGVAPAALTAIK